MERARRFGRPRRDEAFSPALQELESLSDPSTSDSRLYLGALVILTALLLRLVG